MLCFFFWFWFKLVMFFVWQASPPWSWLSLWASRRRKDTAPSPSECRFPHPCLPLSFILKGFLYRLKNLYPSSSLFFFSPSCWLSLEGGLLYSFVGPAAAVVLVCTPSLGWITAFFFPPQVPFYHLIVFVFFSSVKQVNMVIGILVFNKLVSKDGITDVKLKERAG